MPALVGVGRLVSCVTLPKRIFIRYSISRNLTLTHLNDQYLTTCLMWLDLKLILKEPCKRKAVCPMTFACEARAPTILVANL